MSAGKGGWDVEAGTDPLVLFREWLALATTSELNDPNAMALATSTPEGRPSLRMVLLRGLDERGFQFFTNGESRKGLELSANSSAALCFHWKSLRRQVRVEGEARVLPGSDSDAYFATRPRLSQIGAWASAQSRVLGSREELLSEVQEYEAKFPVHVPRPDHWIGFVVRPERIEFWQDGEFRLHDRFSFVLGGDGRWGIERLYP